MRFRLALPLLVAILSLGFLAPAEAAEPTVSITARGYSVAGQSVAFTLRASDGANEPLSLTFEQPGAEPVTLGISSTTNDFEGVYRYTLLVNTKVTARLGEVASDSVTVAVRPVIGTKARSKHAKVGKYAVFARGVEPLFRSGLAPKIWKNRCLRHEVQRYRDGAWRTVVLSGCRSLNSEAQVGWRWTRSHPVGPSFRVRATFAGDVYNAKGPGTWTYFRFR